jgi:hypothetical protein
LAGILQKSAASCKPTLAAPAKCRLRAQRRNKQGRRGGSLELDAPLYLFVLTLRFNAGPVPIGADDQLSHGCGR